MSELIYDVIFLVVLLVSAIYSTVSWIFLGTGSKKLLKESNCSNKKMIEKINKVDNFFETDIEQKYVTDNEYLSARARIGSLKALLCGVLCLIGFVGLFVDFVKKFNSGEYNNVVHKSVPLNETDVIWLIIFSLIGLFWLCSGIFLLVKSGKLLERDIPREKDKLFETVQKLTYLLYIRLKDSRYFIEDKETLVKTAKSNGIMGIVTGGMVIFAVISYVMKSLI